MTVGGPCVAATDEVVRIAGLWTSVSVVVIKPLFEKTSYN